MEEYMRRAARYERAGDEQQADANYRKALRYQCTHFGSGQPKPLQPVKKTIMGKVQKETLDAYYTKDKSNRFHPNSVK